MTECRCSRIISDDAFVCRACAKEAHKDLTEVAYFLSHIDEKRARYTTNWRSGTIGRSPDKPLPYDPRVGRTLTPIRGTLTTWARLHADEHPDHAQPPTDLADIATWLAAYTEWDRGRDWSHEAFDHYQSAHADLKRLFDNPPDREAIGVCGAWVEVEGIERQCPEVLAAEAGATSHSCPKCGAVHDVAERRSGLIDAAKNFGVTTAEAVKLLRTTERHNVDARLVRALIRHAPIPSTGRRTERDIKGRVRHVDTYPLGAIRDALDLYETDRETTREVRRLIRGGARATA